MQSSLTNGSIRAELGSWMISQADGYVKRSWLQLRLIRPARIQIWTRSMLAIDVLRPQCPGSRQNSEDGIFPFSSYNSYFNSGIHPMPSPSQKRRNDV